MISTLKTKRSSVIFMLVIFSMYFFFTTNLFSQTNKYENEFEYQLKNKSLKEKFKILSDTSMLTTDYQKTLFVSQKYLEIANINKNNLEIANGYRLIGRAYGLLNIFNLSQENNYKALKLFENLKDTIGQIRTQNIIAINYDMQDDYQNSIKYYLSSLNLAKKINDLQGISNTLSNLSGVYLAQSDYNNSLKCIFEALKYYQMISDQKKSNYFTFNGISMCYINLGEIHEEKKNLDSALFYYNKALEVNYKINDFNTISSVLINIANLKLQKQNYREAEKVSLQALKLAKEGANIQIVYFALKQLIEANKGLKNYQIALNYFYEYSSVKDTINKNDSGVLSAKLESQREIDKFKLESEIKSTQQRYIYIIVAVVVATLIAILLLIYYQSRAKSKLNKELNELNGTKDKLFSIISHDLKTPISGFRNLSKLMRENADNLSELDKTKYIKNFEDTSNNLLKLLDNLLNWSQIQTGKMRIFPDNNNLKDIIDTEISLFKDISEQKSIVITSDVANQIIFADNDMMHTVFRNLIANALKYSSPNSKIEINANEEKENILITIKDNGIGISNEDKIKLFQIESKISRLGTSGEKGTGLGLTLCKEFVEKNNGQIWFESEPGKGTTFFVSLPKAAED